MCILWSDHGGGCRCTYLSGCGGLIVGGGGWSGVEQSGAPLAPKQTTTVSLTAANDNHHIMHRNRPELPGICLNSDLWPALILPRKTVHNGHNGCSQTHSTRCFLRLLHLGSLSGRSPVSQPAAITTSLHSTRPLLSSPLLLSFVHRLLLPSIFYHPSPHHHHHHHPNSISPYSPSSSPSSSSPNNSLGSLFLPSHTPPRCEKT